jgi:hypothetical protein
VPAAQPALTLTSPVLHSTPGQLGAQVNLSWTTVSGAVDYLVYRIALAPSDAVAPPGDPVGGSTTALTQGLNTQVAAACGGVSHQPSICTMLPVTQTAAQPQAGTAFGFPGPPQYLTRVTAPAYSELPPNSLQALYFVVAEDSSGNLSTPSNVAGGPSLAAQ